MPINKTYQFSNHKYAGYETEQNELVIRTHSLPAIRVKAYNADTVQVWLDPNGTFQKEKSFAIEDESSDYSSFTIEENDEALIYGTENMAVRIQKNPLKLSIVDNSGSVLTSEADSGFGWREDGSIFANFTAGSDEHFFGLGQDNDAYRGTLDRRGTIRDMLTGQTISSGCVTADIPVTFFMSTGQSGKGYGLYFDNTYHCTFDMAASDPNTYTIDAEGGELLFYIFNGPDFNKILTLYTDLTGKPTLPPLWTLGYIQSKCTYRTWDDIDEVIENMRSRGIPMDCVVIDADWPENMINFKFDPRWEDKSEEKMKEHEKNGVKFMLSTSGPMIKKDSSNFQSGLDANIFATDGNGNTVTCGWYGGELMDFTAPNMHDWLKPQLEPLYKMGVKAWWLDLIEPEGEPLQTVYQGGPRARIHNAFALLNTKLYYEIQKEFDSESRPFILGRTATAGTQKYGSSTWTGDVYSDYDTFAAHCPEALNTCLSGIPNWTSDTSGFISSTSDPSLQLAAQLYKNDAAAHGLLYERWMQFSCFGPITRSHHVGPCEPYAHDENVEASCRRYLKLRYRLLPYIYTYTRQACKTGIGIMRPLVYEYQNDPQTYQCKDEFLFGDWLLAAPVFDEFSNARKVYFPEGTWIDYDYGYQYEGPCEAVVYAPRNRMPLFVKSGAIIPMAPELNYVDEKAWDPITFDIWPNGDTTFVMYADDGETVAYERGEFTETTVQCCEEAGKSITLRVSESNKLFTPSTYEFVLHMKNPPIAVSGLQQHSHRNKLEAANCGWFFDRYHNLLVIRVPSTENGSFELSVDLDERSLYRAAAPKLKLDGSALEEEADNSLSTQMPYLLPASIVPCKLQLVNYDRGGEMVAYHMTKPGNPSGLYRDDDVNIDLCTDEGGGYQLTDITAGEWIEYSINVEKPGRYDIFLRVASPEEGASFHVKFNGKNLTGKVSIPSTGSKDEWVTVRYDNLMLQEGEQVLQLVIETGCVCLNYLDIKFS